MKEYPEWKRIIYRGFRTSFASAVAQTVAIKVDWTKPEEAIRTLIVSFFAGFLVAVGMYVRDWFKPDSIVSKVTPI